MTIKHCSINNPDKWSQRYQRNNKHNGFKNIRCFPHCGERHMQNKFCGTPISLLVELDIGQDIEKFIFYGEFHMAGISSNVEEKKSFTEKELISQERRKSNLKKPLYKGELLDNNKQNTFIVHFNKAQQEGWHYGWKSSKHTTYIEHVFKVYIFKRTGMLLELAHSIESPKFTIFCRRRSRKREHQDVDLKPKRIRSFSLLEIQIWRIVQALLQREKELDSNIIDIDDDIDSDHTLSKMLHSILPEISESKAFIPEFLPSHLTLDFVKTPITSSNEGKKPILIQQILSDLNIYLFEKKVLDNVYQNCREESLEKRKQEMLQSLAIAISIFLSRHDYTFDTFIALLPNIQTNTPNEKVHFDYNTMSFPEREPTTTLELNQKIMILQTMNSILTGSWTIQEKDISLWAKHLSNKIPLISQSIRLTLNNISSEGVLQKDISLFCEIDRFTGSVNFPLDDAPNLTCHLSCSNAFSGIRAYRGFIDYISKRLIFYISLSNFERITCVICCSSENLKILLSYQIRKTPNTAWKFKLTKLIIPTKTQSI